MHLSKLATSAALLTATAAHAGVDLYTDPGNGKALGSYTSYADCAKAGAALSKPFSCRAQPIAAAAPAAAGTATAAARAPAPAVAASGAVTAWVRAANTDYTRDPVSAPIGAVVRFGDGLKWVTASMRKGMQCAADQFKADTAGMQYTKWCEVQVAAPAVTQIPGAMPVVNKGLIPLPAIVADGPRVMTLTPEQLANPGLNPGKGSDVGAFRVSCPYSHISNDDPIIYPGMRGAAHLHTFAGSALADANSTTENLLARGASTCAGGSLNRTAYWFPSLIDTRNGQPVVPISTNFYYKGGYQGVDPTKIVPFPKGLRMIAGNAAATKRPADGSPVHFACVGGPNNQIVNVGAQIASCDVGAQLWQEVDFPQCWDGKNLDSPDHKSHMAYGQWRPNTLPTTPGGCPSTHPIGLPAITLNTQYFVAEPGTADYWRLSSDNYAGPGGYSLHADWWGAWDDATMKLWVKNCINAKQDCHNNLLGDGRMLN